MDAQLQTRLFKFRHKQKALQLKILQASMDLNILSEFENNRPVADFLCNNCREEFELKSRNTNQLGNRIVDGAYSTMIERIKSNNNPI